mgnify:CR=1 FL=1
MSSARIISTSLSIRKALRVISSRLPIGVGMRKSFMAQKEGFRRLGLLEKKYFVLEMMGMYDLYLK